MSDIGERSAMYESRSLFCSLHEVRVNGIHKENSDGSTNAHILNAEWSVVDLDAKDDIVDAATEVVDVL